MIDAATIAEKIADAFNATGEARATVSHNEVTVTRQLSRGRTQLMAEITVDDEGVPEVLVDRRRAWVCKIVDSATA